MQVACSDRSKGTWISYVKSVRPDSLLAAFTITTDLKLRSCWRPRYLREDFTAQVWSWGLYSPLLKRNHRLAAELAAPNPHQHLQDRVMSPSH